MHYFLWVLWLVHLLGPVGAKLQFDDILTNADSEHALSRSS